MATDNKVKVILEAVTENFQNNINGAITRLKYLGNAAGNSFKQGETQSKKFGDSLKNNVSQTNNLEKAIGNFVKAMVLVKGVQLGKHFVDEFKKVESKLQEVGTILPEFTDDVKDKLFEDAKLLSDSSGVMMQEVLQSAYDAVSGGINPDDVFPFLNEAEKLATAGVANMADTTALLTTIKNSYGDMGYTVTQASDMIFKTVKLGITTVGELATSMGDIVPQAAQLKIPLEEVNAAVAAMTATKGKGSTAEVMTYFKNLMNELTSETNGIGKIFKENITGKSFAQFIRDGGTFQDAIKLIGAYADSTGQELTNLTGNIRSGMAIVNLSANDMRKFDAALEEVGSSAGATAAAYGIATNTISFKTNMICNKLKNNLLNAVFESSDGINSALDNVLEQLDRLAEDGTLDEFAANIAELITDMINGFNDALPVAIEFFGLFVDNMEKIIGLVKELIALWSILKTGLAIIAIISPLGKAKVIFTAIVAALGAISAFLNSMGIKFSIFDTLYNSLKKVFGMLLGINEQGRQLKTNLNSKHTLPSNDERDSGSGDGRRHDRPVREGQTEESPVYSFSPTSSGKKQKEWSIEDDISYVEDKYEPQYSNLESQRDLAEGKNDTKTVKSVTDIMIDVLNQQAADLLKLRDAQGNAVNRLKVDTARNRILSNILQLLGDVRNEMIGQFNAPSELNLLSKYNDEMRTKLGEVINNKYIRGGNKEFNFEINYRGNGSPEELKQAIQDAINSAEMYDSDYFIKKTMKDFKNGTSFW